MQRTKYKQIYIAIFGALITGLITFNAWFLYENFKNVQSEINSTNDSIQILGELKELLLDSINAETGARGFLLTQDDVYLGPYHSGRTRVWTHLELLKSITKGNDVQQAALIATERVLVEHFSALEATIGEKNISRSKIQERLEKSKVFMDSLRAYVSEMEQEERRELEHQKSTTSKSKEVFIWSLIITNLLSAAIILVTFFLISRYQKKAQLELHDQSKLTYEKELIAQISLIFNETSVLSEIGEKLLIFFSKNFGAVAGRLIALDNEHLQVVSTYGVTDNSARKSFHASDKSKNNLVEAAIDRQEIWKIKDVPSNYWDVSSSMGESKPNTLILIPLIMQREAIGVVELGQFGDFSEDQIQLLKKLKSSIASGLASAIHRASIQTLLAKSQQQSEELQASEEEMRVNNEELEQQAKLLERHQRGLDEKNQELLEVQAQLEERAELLEQSSQYKSEFLAKMSHELRTPLNGLLILSTLLKENKEGNLTDQQIDFAKSIQTAGNDLLALINDILDLAKIEAMKLTLRPESFYLKYLIESEEKAFEFQAKDKNLEFRVEVSDELRDLNLYTDRLRLEQILRNFLSNAIKFTEKGSVILKIESDRKKDNLTFRVIDTGIGIPTEKCATIFEAFEQSDGSISRRYGGTGLGLTISKELANLLGGHIRVSSEEGVGSEFSITIPTEYISANNNEEHVAKEPKEEIFSSPPRVSSRELDPKKYSESNAKANEILKKIPEGVRTILIVEDDEKFRSTISESVKNYDFYPIEVGNGEVALALLHEYAPDAILLDIKLPGISGLGILELIKQIAHLRHIPVHMISAMDHHHRALKMGAMGYLTKPVTLDKIKAAMERIETTLSKSVKQVLLVEDDERQNKAVSELIGGEDIEVVSVHTAEAAMVEIKRSGFDCIILDLTLPDFSGGELLEVLTSLDISLPPIIIYTGKDLSDEEEQKLRRYSGSIIIKGVRSPERLLDEVNLFLHRIETTLSSEKQQLITQLRSSESAFQDKTVLVVDDDIRNIFALTSALESKGLNVRVARDGLDALSAVDEHKDIDLVLMDIMMPNMDGYEAMKRMRENSNKRVKEIPIVALTAKAMKEDYEKCIEAGANDYLPKPVNLDNLFTILKVWLAKYD